MPLVDRVQNLKKCFQSMCKLETHNIQCIFKNELKACFFHDASYSKYKDVPNSQTADRILMDEALKMSGNESLDGYQRSLTGMIHKFFEKKIQVRQGWLDELAYKSPLDVKFKEDLFQYPAWMKCGEPIYWDERMEESGI